MIHKNILNTCCLIIVISFLVACKVQKPQLNYFQGNLDSIKNKVAIYTEPFIQKGDLLQITVSASDPMSALNFNQQTTVSQSGGGISVPGYTVDPNGYIQFPQIGLVQVLGLKTKQASDTIMKKLLAYLKDPIVKVKIANYKITVLGEVYNPGVHVVSNEKINILDALGLSGDMTVYAKKNAVLLIRQVDDKTDFYRIDMTKTDIFTKPYFWLQQNDVVYVETYPQKFESVDTKQSRDVGVIVGIVTSFAVLLNTLWR